MEKKKYIIPNIEIILLDNEISLALESLPPVGPDELSLLEMEQLQKNPFYNNKV